MEPQDRTPGWKAYGEGLERWWTGSQWSETYRAVEAPTAPQSARKPGSEGKPWSDPESDPLADLAEAAQRWRRPLTGPEMVREAIRKDRGGEAPLTPQGFA